MINNHRNCEHDPCQWCAMTKNEQDQHRQQEYDDNIGWGARMLSPIRKNPSNETNFKENKTC